jgi:streptogramin lyase
VRSLVPKLLVAPIVLAALVWVPAASAAPAVTGKFELGTEFEMGGNNKIVAGPDGNMWFTLEGTKDVGMITPAGLIREFELPGVVDPNGIAPARKVGSGW